MMDYGHQQDRKERKVTVFQGDELFFKKLLSRNTSIGCSSRIYYYYYRNPEGVPFKWEMQPGTPKDPPKEEAANIPPLSPPPAVLSLGLPKPNIPIQPHKDFTRAWLKLWKNMKIFQPSKKVMILGRKEAVKSSNDHHESPVIKKCPSFELYGSDGEFTSSTSPRVSTSSSSSSISFPGDHSSQWSRLQSPSRKLIKLPFTCSPLNISSIISKVAKRT